ncbi:MAG: amidase family protein, partial [Alcaligenaceae bacterium]
ALALSGTLDSIGPMTRDMQDSAILTELMAGADPLDPTSCGHPMFKWQAPPEGAKPLQGMRIAMFPAAQYPIAVGADIVAILENTRRVLVELGAQLIEKPFPFDFKDMMVRNGHITAAEAYAIHRAYIDDMSRPIGEFVRRRVQSGRNISGADYIDAMADHRRTTAAWTAWMGNVDALLSPCAPMGACPWPRLTRPRRRCRPLLGLAIMWAHRGPRYRLVSPITECHLGFNCWASPLTTRPSPRLGLRFSGSPSSTWHAQTSKSWVFKPNAALSWAPRLNTNEYLG